MTPRAWMPTHEELTTSNMLSVIANLTPWSDYNQSPRNMYQCQMGKQTMGFPLHAFPARADNKLYRLQTPQAPIARTATYNKYGMDEYPTGTNAVVAVLAYTGYDMEDAMIINKSSMERGLCHGTIYKTETIDLTPKRKGDAGQEVFGRPTTMDGAAAVGADGLPVVGQRLRPNDGYCSVVTKAKKSSSSVHKLKGTEEAVVDQVTLIGNGKDVLQQVNVRLRFDRRPVIGDKFSSRHGQKGVLSQLWPDVDMPFSDHHGIRPDIIINPHAFPSRMTIGMLVESLASKTGALRGEFVDATPFQSARETRKKRRSRRQAGEEDEMGGSGEEEEADEEEEEEEEGRGVGVRAPDEGGDASISGGGLAMVDEFGRRLSAHGYSYHGTEAMYSGVLGSEMECHIFMGLVYYQRLRHMVSDKFQVRSIGPVNKLHRQPVKGRKFGGGIRFGEMERDSLLAHGAAFLLHDRLHACSDYHTMDVCSRCGSLLSPEIATSGERIHLEPSGAGPGRPKVSCRVCKNQDTVERVAMPYVFKYLASELAAMNIKLQLHVQDS